MKRGNATYAALGEAAVHADQSTRAQQEKSVEHLQLQLDKISKLRADLFLCRHKTSTGTRR